MKGLFKYGLCLTLGLASGRSFAQEVQWRPASGVTLSRPTPANAPDHARALLLVRGQNPDDKPLPPGPSLVPGPAGNKIVGAPPALRPIAPTTESAKGEPKGAELLNPPKAFGKEPPTYVWGGIPGENSGPLGCAPASDACFTPGCGTKGRLWDRLTSCNLFAGNCGTDNCFGGAGVADCCPPRSPFWAYGEYLLWYAKEQNVPPLVTTSPGTVDAAVAGILGPNSTVLYDRIDNNPRSGGRFGLGFWFPRNDNWGADANFFFLANRSGSFTASTSGGPGSAFIARPIINAVTGAEDAVFVGGNNIPTGLGFTNIAGSVTINDYSRIWGADFNLRRKLWCSPCGWLDGLIGYRHFSLSEGIEIIDTEVADQGIFGISSFVATDNFHTRNTFNGAQLGLAGERRLGQRWFLAGNAKIALGAMQQTVSIHGNTAINVPGITPSVQPGGILALPTNSGDRSANSFAVIPEIGINLGYDITDHLRVYAGYNFMYVSDVVRPAEQIDRVVNRSQIPNALGTQTLVGAPRPAVLFQTSDFWLHGVNFGLQYHW